jgi:hypothetical protein
MTLPLEHKTVFSSNTCHGRPSLDHSSHYLVAQSVLTLTELIEGYRGLDDTLQGLVRRHKCID